MVGVPGKSKGCNTCRKRKVKCDGERPACGQCTRLRRECTGYIRETHFKNLSALDHDTIVVRKQPLVPKTEPSVFRPQESNGSTSTGSTGSDSTKRTSPEELLRDPPPLSDSGSINLHNLFTYFLSTYVPETDKTPSDHPVSWLTTVPNMQSGGGEASLNMAITALSLVRLGRQHQSKELQAEGMTVYGQALDAIQKMLSSDDLLFQEQTLAGCMALSIFEVLELSGSDIRGWVSHVDGLSRLFQLRGPEQHVAESSHNLFLGFRATGIIHAIATRKPNYLSEEAWLTVPWTVIPKSDFHHLLDIITQIPAIIQRTECLTKSPCMPSLSSDVDSILQQNWAAENKLTTWYKEITIKSLDALYIEEPATPILSTSRTSLPTLSCTSLTFPTFEVARMHLFYWSGLLLIYNNILSIYHIHSSHLSHIAHHVPQITDLILSTAHQITQTIPYLLSPQLHILGPQNVFFPLRNAMRAFQICGREDEGKWCRDVFEELDRRGYPFGMMVAGVEWEDIPAFLGVWNSV